MLAAPARIRIRPLGPDEGTVLDEVFAGLSPASRLARYLAPLSDLTPRTRAALTAVDGDRHVAFVAEAGRGTRRSPVGLARYVADDRDRAEVAYEVVDAWQGRGVGDRLVATLVHTARRRGIAELHATVRLGNDASLALLSRHVPTLRLVQDGDLWAACGSLRADPLDAAELLADLAIC